MPDETPTASQPIATPQQLEQATQGRIKQSNPYAEQALASASKTVRNLCGWHIAPKVTEALRVDGRGGTILQLPTLHLIGIGSLTETGSALTPDVDFEWSENGVLERHPGWSRRRRGIIATVEHGWELDQVPEVVDLVCTLAARGLVAAKVAGAVREQAGTNSVQYGTAGGVAISIDVLDHEVAKLRPYIVPGRS